MERTLLLTGLSLTLICGFSDGEVNSCSTPTHGYFCDFDGRNLISEMEGVLSDKECLGYCSITEGCVMYTYYPSVCKQFIELETTTKTTTETTTETAEVTMKNVRMDDFSDSFNIYEGVSRTKLPKETCRLYSSVCDLVESHCANTVSGAATCNKCPEQSNNGGSWHYSDSGSGYTGHSYYSCGDTLVTKALCTGTSWEVQGSRAWCGCSVPEGWNVTCSEEKDGEQFPGGTSCSSLCGGEGVCMQGKWRGDLDRACKEEEKEGKG